MRRSRSRICACRPLATADQTEWRAATAYLLAAFVLAAFVSTAFVIPEFIAPALGGMPAEQLVPAQDIESDLDLFASEVAARSAYLQLAPMDFDAAVAAVRRHNQSRGGLTLGELGAALQQILAATGDPAARVFGVDPPGPFLPFAIIPVQDRYIATWHDGAGFLVADQPYLSTLAGDPVGIWLGRLDNLLPAGPATYRRQIGLDLLQAFGEVRKIAERESDNTVTVRVSGAELGTGQDITVALAGYRAGQVIWPQHDSAVLTGNIGYLRLPRMGSRAVDQIRRWMPRFERTVGLIVDVRGNTGGTRDAFRELFPYFIRFDDPPFVAAATIYREHPATRPTATVDLTGQTADWPNWRVAEGAAIKAFRARFAPADSTVAAVIGPWRYLVVARREKDPRYPYLEHIIVLMDGACRGSTELLLASCQGRFKISLMGTPSGGAPDGAEAFVLPRTSLRIEVSSLVTYLADGRRLGAASIEPDILSFPVPESFLPVTEDVQLEYARKYLVARKGLR